ncbi:MAG: exo-alpha-sialidase, partial [Ignavibacteriae bacterium]|nr:exo-alpha-sialidase [Ignavibacteriota bacterium]
SCGIVWGPFVQLSKPGVGAHRPCIVARGETLHVTWDFGGGYRLPYARSTDGGITWEETRELLPDSTQYTRLALNPYILANQKTLFIIYISTHGNGVTPVYCITSTDGGTTWSNPVPTTPDSSYNVLDAAIHGDTIVVVYPTEHRKLLRSADGGKSWELSKNKQPRGVPKHALTHGILHQTYQEDTITHVAFETMYRWSTDIGDSWSDSLVLTTMDEDYSYLAVIGTAIIDSGKSYLFSSWRDTKYGCRTMVGCSVILRRSTDNGQTWEPEKTMTELPNGVTQPFSFGLISSYRNMIGVVWNNDELRHINFRYSLNGGTTWSDLCDVTPNGRASQPSSAVTSSAFHVVWSEYEYVNDYWRIYYRRGVLFPNAMNEETVQPKSFMLEQNYPNPFNSSTVIRYQLSVSGYVTLKVYNLLGQEVATLVDGFQESGSKSEKWNVNGLPSGVYYYRLNVFHKNFGMTSVSKTMVVTN